MFLDRHPDRPGKKSDLKHLGYWHSVLLDPKTMLVVDTGMSFDHYEESFGKEGLPLPSEQSRQFATSSAIHRVPVPIPPNGFYCAPTWPLGSHSGSYWKNWVRRS